MILPLDLPGEWLDAPDFKPFALFRDHIRPMLEARRKELDAMYEPVLGRPEIDPVLLMGLTILQMMERLPDRQASAACRFDLRWRIALALPADWEGLHPVTLCNFRSRLAQHGQGRLALDAALAALRAGGHLASRSPVRIDSTHVLGAIATLSRLDCVRETLRLALIFLNGLGGPEVWEPWLSTYVRPIPEQPRNPAAARVKTTMEQAGRDAASVLEQAGRLGADVTDAVPVALLQRVFDEQFERVEGGAPAARPCTPAGSVHSPHDAQAQWSTKGSLGKPGWVGYKAQVCETAPEQPRAQGEPTAALITAVVVQPATTSDHGSLAPVLEAQQEAGQESADTVFADAGYVSAPALDAATTAGYELCGPVGAPPHGGKRFGSDAFDVNLPARTARCPSGNSSATCARISERGGKLVYYYFEWASADCAACPQRTDCLSAKKKRPFRTLQVGERHMVVQARRALCKTPDYQVRMRRRNAIEGTHSELKRGYGLRRCRYRGLSRTAVQMQTIAAACNLRRWAARLNWIERQQRKIKA